VLTALIVEDDRSTLLALSEFVEEAGFTTTTAATFEEARAILRQNRLDLVLLDIVLPDGSGIDLLLELPSHARPHVLLMSGQDAVKQAVQSLSLQTVRFLRKPVDSDSLARALSAVRKACGSKAKPKTAPLGGRMLGRSAVMQEVLRLVERVGPTDYSVLIEGESGTGKELLAEAVHQCSSRAKQAFLPVNCGAFPDTLIDSELFGHERGAFTGATTSKPGVFEQADGGTLFLDELAEMPLDVQVRLLRVLETQQVRRVGGTRQIDVDVRVIAATNRPVAEALRENLLREDLVHRLSVFPILLPPLRERTEDIEELTQYFLEEAAKREGRDKTLAPATWRALLSYRWPGNIRQLRNAVQHAFVLAEGDTITPDCLPRPIRERTEEVLDEQTSISEFVGSTIAETERRLIEATLQEYGGDKRATAETLGISLRTLYNRLKEYGRAEVDEELPEEADNS
jgi:DNA-binding NtrC family response regulator